MRTQHSGRSKPTGVNECHGMNLKGHRIPDWRMVRVYRYTLQKCGFRPLCFFYMIGDMWNIWKNATTTSENVVNPMRNFESGIVFSTQMVHNLVDNEIHDQVQNMQCGKNTKHSSFVEKAESVSINMSQWLFRALIVRIPNCSQNNSKTAPNNHGDVRKNNSRLEFAVAWQTQKQRYDLGTLWHQLPAIMMGYIFHGPCNRTDCSYDLAGMNNWAFGWFLGFLCFFSHNPNAMETHQVFALLIILVGSTAQPVLPSPNWGQKTMA